MVEWENELSRFRRVLDLRDKAAAEGKEYPLPRPVVEILNRQPDVDDGEMVFLTAYRALSTCRPEGFAGDRPIPWWCIDLYATRHGFDEDPDYMSAFLHIMREMDAADRRWHRDHPPPKAQPTPPADPRRGRRDA